MSKRKGTFHAPEPPKLRLPRLPANPLPVPPNLMRTQRRPPQYYSSCPDPYPIVYVEQPYDDSPSLLDSSLELLQAVENPEAKKAILVGAGVSLAVIAVVCVVGMCVIVGGAVALFVAMLSS
jgi:hypothetical protein